MSDQRSPTCGKIAPPLASTSKRTGPALDLSATFGSFFATPNVTPGGFCPTPAGFSATPSAVSRKNLSTKSGEFPVTPLTTPKPSKRAKLEFESARTESDKPVDVETSNSGSVLSLESSSDSSSASLFSPGSTSSNTSDEVTTTTMATRTRFQQDGRKYDLVEEISSSEDEEPPSDPPTFQSWQDEKLKLEDYWNLTEIKKLLDDLNSKKIDLIAASAKILVCRDILKNRMAKRRLQRLQKFRERCGKTHGNPDFFTLQEYLAMSIGNALDFWKEPYVLAVVNEVVVKKRTLVSAEKLLGVSKNLLQTKVNMAKQKSEKGTDIDEIDKLSEYEVIRLENIEKKKKLFEEMGLKGSKESLVIKANRVKKLVETPLPLSAFTRRQARLLANPPPVPHEDIPSDVRLPLDDIFSSESNYFENKKFLTEFVKVFDVNDSKKSKRLYRDSILDLLNVKESQKAINSTITICDVMPEVFTEMENVPTLALSTGTDGLVSIWCKEKSCQFRSHAEEVTSVTFNPYRSSQLLTSGSDGLIRSFDLKESHVDVVYKWNLHHGDSSKKPVCFHKVLSHNELLLGIGDKDKSRKEIYLFDMRTGTSSFVTFGSSICPTASSMQPNRVAVPFDNSVSLLDLRFFSKTMKNNGREIIHTLSLTSKPLQVEFCNNGKHLMVSMVKNEEENLVQVFDVKNKSGFRLMKETWSIGRPVWHPGDGNVFVVPQQVAGDARRYAISTIDVKEEVVTKELLMRKAKKKIDLYANSFNLVACNVDSKGDVKIFDF